MPPASTLSNVVADLVRASMGASVPTAVTDDELDRHVTELILKEAKQKETLYKGQQGVRAYLPDTGLPENNLPKPNKRFLNAVIKNVGDHNAAIIDGQAKNAQAAREAIEAENRAQRRLRADEAAADRMRRLMGGGSGSTRWKGKEKERSDESQRSRRRSRSRDNSNDERGSSSAHRETVRISDDERHRKHRRRRSRSEERTSSKDLDQERRPSESTGEHHRRRRDPEREEERDRRSRKDRKRSRSRSPSRRDKKRKRSRSHSKERPSLPPKIDLSLPSSSTPPRISAPSAESENKAVVDDAHFEEPTHSHSTLPQIPSKMDKYFDPAYDPLLDTGPASKSLDEFVPDGAFDDWNIMLETLQRRREEKEERKRREKSEKRDGKKRKHDDSADDKERQRRIRLGIESPGVMDITYTKKGGIREWDLGKKDPA